MSDSTLREYILKTLKEILQDRFDDKGSCSHYTTFMSNARMCKECKIEKSCSFWTKLIEEQEKENETLNDKIIANNDDDSGGVEIIGMGG